MVEVVQNLDRRIVHLAGDGERFAHGVDRFVLRLAQVDGLEDHFDLVLAAQVHRHLQAVHDGLLLLLRRLPGDAGS